MDFDRKDPARDRPRDTNHGTDDLCWKEILSNAIGGWTPADQALEHVIDRLEWKS